MQQKPCALVTGASRGIGRAIAEALAAAGYPVALNCVSNLALAEEAARQIEATYGVPAQAFPADVSRAEEAERLIAKVLEAYGNIHVLVNNAGIARDALIMRMTQEDLDRVLDVNLKAAFYCTRYVSNHMLKRRAGRIISISSVVGLTGNAGQANYAAAKAGLIGMTKSVARELGGRGITVNAVAPGWIDTDMTKDLPDAAAQNWMSRIPLKRPGKPEEVAGLVSFLASDAAAYITGQVIAIDGGLSM